MKQGRLLHRRRIAPRSSLARFGAAIAVTSMGALAIGAVAVGALAINALVVRTARIRRLEIDELVVGGRPYRP